MKRSGFTIVELVVVIILLGILAGVDPRNPSLAYTPEDGWVEVANPP